VVDCVGDDVGDMRSLLAAASNRAGTDSALKFQNNLPLSLNAA
jgi:hypothetical protein